MTVIPQSMRPEILRRLYAGHSGMEMCKILARTAIHWSRTHADIDRKISSCQTCLRYQAEQPKEPMAMTDLPDEHWQKVGTDLFHLDGKENLLVIITFQNIQRWCCFLPYLLHVLSNMFDICINNCET